MISTEADAIVLDSREHGESDKIITVLTPDAGKISGIAKGASRSKKRFLNKLELFSHLTLTYSERKFSNLVFIEEAELLSSFITLRSGINPYTTATLLREVLLVGTPERQGDRGIFDLLHWSLSSLDEGRSHLAVAAAFLLRFYERLGYCPDFTCCRQCGSLYRTDTDHSFHHASGGLVCSRCMNSIHDTCSELSPGTIKLLEAVLSEPLSRLGRLHFSRQALVQSLYMLHKYGRNLFQREIQSWKALQRTITL